MFNERARFLAAHGVRVGSRCYGLAAAQLCRAELPIAQYAIDTWTTADGLPQNSITAIEQTQDGYLWLGTFNGLVRFDGVTSPSSVALKPRAWPIGSTVCTPTARSGFGSWMLWTISRALEHAVLRSGEIRGAAG